MLQVIHRTLWEAFNTWLSHTLELKRHFGLLNKAIRHLNNCLLSRSWARWQLVVDSRQELENRLQGIGRRIMHKEMGEAFNAWQGNAAELAFHRRRANHVVRMIQNRRAAVAFNAWETEVSDHRRKEVAAAKCLSRMASRALARAFSTWLECVLEVSAIPAQAVPSATLGSGYCILKQQMTLVLMAALVACACRTAAPSWRFPIDSQQGALMSDVLVLPEKSQCLQIMAVKFFWNGGWIFWNGFLYAARAFAE